MATDGQEKSLRRATIATVVVLVAMAGLLLALVPQAILMMREKSNRELCRDNLKQIGQGCHNFEGIFKRLPPLYGGTKGDVQNSQKFARVWGGTHLFLAAFTPPYAYFDNAWQQFVKSEIGPGDEHIQVIPLSSKSVPEYVCPSDPSVLNGMVIGGTYGGTSYAANAQVFAPLQGELVTSVPDGKNGAMEPATFANFTDRFSATGRILDGASNTILFTHTYALCGSTSQGAAWGYSAGIGNPPAALDTFQPWSRASYINQTYMTPETAIPFQIQPDPYDKKCVLTDPASPHPGIMTVLFADGSTRDLAPTISARAWNVLCLPNNQQEVFPE